ncbi:MAG: hypothetical protein SFU57_07830 [Gemmatimonadales bacterium]|nr:hypothetical protein [Gemmatimonadales bacterium]
MRFIPHAIRFAAGLAVLLAGAVAEAHAQASLYVPADDPKLPLLEHLIRRGDVVDPTPMVRPFRRSEVLAALRAANVVDPDSPFAWQEQMDGGEIRKARLIQSLIEYWGEPELGDTLAGWSFAIEAGAQGYTTPRRDLLHPVDGDDVEPYFEVGASLVHGPFAIASRAIADRRLFADPDWTGRKTEANGYLVYRFPEAYVSMQGKYGELLLGVLTRNWGPVGDPGLSISDIRYPQGEIGVRIGTGRIRLLASAQPLTDGATNDGQRIERGFFAHRLSVQLSRTLNLALWETAVVGRQDRGFDSRFTNIAAPLILLRTFGFDDDLNTMTGIDVHWRASPGLLVETQLAFDEPPRPTKRRSGRPQRWGGAAALSGALGPSLGWRVGSTWATAVAFQTGNATQNFIDDGVGLGRNFNDNLGFSGAVSIPVGTGWLLSPEVNYFLQGEGRIQDALPPREELFDGALPIILTGVESRTLRLGGSISGKSGPFELQGAGGWNRVADADHIPGRTTNRFEGRVQMSLGFRLGGVFDAR